jgi:hypothetical protein
MRVRTIDDEIFAAGTPEELVELMALASYGETGAVEEVVREFVAQTAARARPDGRADPRRQCPRIPGGPGSRGLPQAARRRTGRPAAKHLLKGVTELATGCCGTAELVDVSAPMRSHVRMTKAIAAAGLYYAPLP